MSARKVVRRQPRPPAMHHPKAAAPSSPAAEYRFQLYVAGTSSRSRQAILRARELCAGELHGHGTLEVIDIYQQPDRARSGQIIATPTLVKLLPLPVRRLIGTPARAGRLFVALGLHVPGKQDP